MNPVYVDRLVKDRQAQLLHAARVDGVPSGIATPRSRLLAVISYRCGSLLVRIGQRLLGVADSALANESPSVMTRLTQGHR